MVNISLFKRNRFIINMYIFNKLRLCCLGYCYNWMIAQLEDSYFFFFLNPTNLYSFTFSPNTCTCNIVPILCATYFSDLGINGGEKSVVSQSVEAPPLSVF